MTLVEKCQLILKMMDVPLQNEDSPWARLEAIRIAMWSLDIGGIYQECVNVWSELRDPSSTVRMAIVKATLTVLTKDWENRDKAEG